MLQVRGVKKGLEEGARVLAAASVPLPMLPLPAFAHASVRAIVPASANASSTAQRVPGLYEESVTVLLLETFTGGAANRCSTVRAMSVTIFMAVAVSSLKATPTQASCIRGAHLLLDSGQNLILPRRAARQADRGLYKYMHAFHESIPGIMPCATFRTVPFQ
jgi:hypothetical protein